MIRDDYDIGDSLDKQVHEDIDRINNAGQHLLRLISSLLDHSKIEAGQMTVNPETLCLQKTLVHIVDEVNAIARRHNTTIVQDVPQQSIEVVSDHVMLTQIVTNLMSNALKFSKGGTVTLRLRDHAEHVELEVEDTGIGMTPEQLEHVFDAFTQADATTTRAYGGTGLGLSLVKHFGSLIGAEIHVTSTLGTGSTFHVILPKIMTQILTQTEH
jgi:signal transduction histidine kinase